MQVLIIADDLTGANDSAAQFAKKGFKTAVAIYKQGKMPKLSDYDLYDVLVIDSESRDLPSEDARFIICDIYDYIQSILNNVLIYKKVDSTLRGNVGIELATLIAQYNPILTVFAPAYIESFRTTVDGYQYLYGIPLEKTELANIPKSPITTSYIPEILAKNSNLISSIIDLKDIESGEDNLKRTINAKLEEKKNLFCFDATKREHLDLIAKTALSYRQLIFCGSAGLANAISSNIKVKNLENKAKEYKDIKHLLYLCGSISEISRKQSHKLVENTDCLLVRLDLKLALQDPLKAAEVHAKDILLKAKQHKVVLVSGAYEEKDVVLSKALCEKYQINFFKAGELVAQTMGAVMALVHKEFDAFVMTGGDSAVHSSDAVDARVFEIEDEIENGIAQCKIASGSCRGKILISKAGAFGLEDTFLNIFTKLCNNN